MAPAMKLLAIAGQTASGKSDLAMKLANTLDGEIICADSRTVFIGMDIATAKPSKEDRSLIPHWCLDLVEPGTAFSAYDFQIAAKAAISNIQSRGKLPILVGGSGLYVDSVLYDLPLQPARAVAQQLKDASLDELKQMAKEQFPVEVLTPDTLGNRRRLERMLSGGYVPGSPLRRQLPPGTRFIGIMPDQEVLRKRIASRVVGMVKDGLLDEVESVGRSAKGESATAIAYRAFAEYLAGKASVDDALVAFIQGDIRLAKKQLTWFKRDPNIEWFKSGSEAFATVADELSSIS